MRPLIDLHAIHLAYGVFCLAEVGLRLARRITYLVEVNDLLAPNFGAHFDGVVE